MAGEIKVVTWERVQDETWQDEKMRKLIGAIKSGLNVEELDEDLAD